MLIASTAGGQETEQVKVSKIGVRPSVQLGSTYLGTNLVAEYYIKKHLLYAGPKLQITNSLSFGRNPIGLDIGYGYRVIESESFNFYLIADIQWISWKHSNQ